MGMNFYLLGGIIVKKYPELVVYALDGGVQSYILEQAAQGKLPNFKRFIESATIFEDCRPPYPSITPTCWASFSTGTTPDVHGVTDQDIHFPGTPWIRWDRATAATTCWPSGSGRRQAG